MCIFHDWNKWQQYSEENPERRISKNYSLRRHTVYMQKKQCKKCGIVRVKEINRGFT